MELQIQDVRKSFGEREILHGVSFTVRSGRAMGFLGRNGAGKSTTIRCLMDVFRPDSGRFLLDGQAFRPRKMKIGYLPEERGLYQKSETLSQLVYFARLRGCSKTEAVKTAAKWVDYFGLGDFKNKKLETLSKGNQQKIQIAQAFLGEPDILILDEPFSGLDPVNAQVFKDTIADFVKQGRLVIFSSHQMGYVEEVCDDVTLIHEGNILLSGDLEAVKRAEGSGKLILQAAEPSPPGWREALAQAFPDVLLTDTPRGVVLDTKGRDLQAGVLRWLAGQSLTVRNFGAYEPLLTEIFIRKAGDRA